MNKYWIPGPITNYGTTDAGFAGEVRVVKAADYDALAARLAEAESECLEQARLNGMGSEREARLLARLAEAERDKEHLQRAVNRACQVFREDVLAQDIDGTTTARVELFLATYGTADSAPAVRRCIYCDVPETEWSRVPLCCAPDGNGHIAPRVRSTADAVQQEDR